MSTNKPKLYIRNITVRHKYGDIDEVVKAMNDIWFDDDGNCKPIEKTPENEELVEECMFWCGVNLVRFTYPHDWLNELLSMCLDLKRRWAEDAND